MLSAFSAAILGFLLGLRHATDADHVVAVSAIVARERTMRRAAWIGVLWGIGHSITVFVVGGAIIAFRLVIPPRLGLALEFGVALMLIILGFSNLRGGPSRTDPSHTHAFDGRKPLLIGTVHLVADDRQLLDADIGGQLLYPLRRFHAFALPKASNRAPGPFRCIRPQSVR